MRLLRTCALAITAAATLAGLAVPAVAAEPDPTVVTLTFDDGYANNGPALDMLAARGLPATFYVNSQRLGMNSTWLTPEQVQGHVADGHEVGGHSLNHENLADLTYEQAKANVCADRANLVDLGVKVTSFAYPYGANNADTRRAVQDCGYNSARLVSDLRGVNSCTNCAVGESIPPVNPYAVRAVNSVRSWWTPQDVKDLITYAEQNGGGWVPLVFHRICDGCASNAMSLAHLTEVADWLANRPGSTTVRTVDQVVGGSVKPVPGEDVGQPQAESVTIGIGQSAIDGTNVRRTANTLVLYTHGASTGTNKWGTEVAVVDGKVTKVERYVGNMAIPANGYVLSGHGTGDSWLAAFASVGATVTLNTAPPPEPEPVVVPSTQVSIGSATFPLTGVNVRRTANAMVAYTTPTTGTNQWGIEAAVVGGVITKIESGVGNMAVPAGGYVLSGHGDARVWLQTHARVGVTVIPD